jgi:hypothetical protein
MPFEIQVLGAVQHVVIAFLLCAQADRLQVGARIRLRERQPAADRRLLRTAEDIFSSIRNTRISYEQRHHQMRVEDAGERHPGLGDARHDARVELCGKTQARRTAG